MAKTGMQIRSVKTEQDHVVAVARIENSMKAVPGTPEGAELDMLATMVDAYETKHHAMNTNDHIFNLSGGQDV
jgi:HTH-type transcriptional regulator/antitoxin HigA